MSTVPPNDVRDAVSYDPCTGIFYRIEAAGCASAGTRADRPDKNGYRRVSHRGKTYLAHRLAFYFVNGEWPSLYVDHINGVTSDNRIVNLRLATPHQNTVSSKSKGACKKGVTTKGDGTFRAAIFVSGKKLHLGTFSSEELAHQAYAKAATEAFGEFARLA